MTQLQELSQSLSAAVDGVKASIVSVGGKGSRSSGFVWRPGLVVTADEALAEDGAIEVRLPGGEAVGARLAGRDPTTDVAVLRIDRMDLPACRLAALTPVAGALAIAVGASGGAPVASLGIVSAASGPWRSMRGGEIDQRIDLDVSLRGSCEGGVVLDASGQAFGMAVLGPRKRALVIPTATIERVAAKLETHGRIGRGYLGLGLHPVAVDGADGKGAIVLSVDPKGPAAQAGMHQGDVIVAWNGEPVRRIQQVLRTLGPDSIGTKLALTVRRAGKTEQIALEIGERPAA